MKDLTLVGRRIKLTRFTDPYTHLPEGLLGTVVDIDDAGTIEVDWDNGSKLGLCREAGDAFEVIGKGVVKASPGKTRYTVDLCHVRREVYSVTIEAKDPVEAAALADVLRVRTAEQLAQEFESSGSQWHLVEDGVEVMAVNVETQAG